MSDTNGALITEPVEVRGVILFTRAHCDCPCGEDGHPTAVTRSDLQSALAAIELGESFWPVRLGVEPVDESDVRFLLAELERQDAAIDGRRAANGFRIKTGDR